MTRLLDLDGYVTGELDDTAADAFEEALFDAPDDPDVQLLDRLARDGARLVAHCAFDAGVSRGELDALIAAGHAVQIVDAGPPGRFAWSMTADAEIVVTKLALARRDLDRVDVEITLPDHGVTKVIRDVLVDPSDGTIYGLCERPLAALAFSAGRTITRVLQRDVARSLIAEWEFVPPSPG